MKSDEDRDTELTARIRALKKKIMPLERKRREVRKRIVTARVDEEPPSAVVAEEDAEAAEAAALERHCRWNLELWAEGHGRNLFTDSAAKRIIRRIQECPPDPLLFGALKYARLFNLFGPNHHLAIDAREMSDDDKQHIRALLRSSAWDIVDCHEAGASQAADDQHK